MFAIVQHRHQRLRIELAKCRGELLPAPARQMHWHVFVLETLEIERDANAVGGRAAEVAEELHRLDSGYSSRLVSLAVRADPTRLAAYFTPTRSCASRRALPDRNRRRVYSHPKAPSTHPC